ncbi:MAG: hypothetical protein Q8R91_05880 [Candidatus Omnitrophota bacterium]|nr:hypothetical protein [Candidatus Omnitrophota bacterium]
MGKQRAFLQRWQTRRHIDHQEGARTAYALYETAWADAWSHLDDWFMTEAFFIGRGRVRPGIA